MVLIQDYQRKIDRQFDKKSLKSIEETFAVLSKKEFMKTNVTAIDEVIDNNFEYKLCDFYDSYLNRYMKDNHISEIIDIAKVLGLPVNSKVPTYALLNTINILISKQIPEKCDEVQKEYDGKKSEIEFNKKKYTNISDVMELTLNEYKILIDSISRDKNITFGEIAKCEEELSSISNQIEIVKKELEEAEQEAELQPRGFLRYLSDANSISKELVEAKKRELDELEKHFNQKSDGMGEFKEPLSRVMDGLQKVIEVSKNRLSSKDSQLSESSKRIHTIVKEIMNDNTVIEEGYKKLQEEYAKFISSSAMQEANEIYKKELEQAQETLKLLPTEEQKEMLDKVGNQLKRHRFFVLDLFKEYENIDAKDITRGSQLFTLLAFYFLHVGRSDRELDYLFIDEGQDYSEAEYRILRAIHRDSCRFEIYGDTLQCVTPNRGLKNWNYLKNLFKAEYFELKENYRNTVEIADYINKNVINIFNPIGFTGPEVKEVFATRNRLVDVCETTKRVAVICHDKTNIDRISEAALTYLNKEGVLYSVIESKGLEFDEVYVITDGMDKNEEYVAFSRSLKKLVIYK